jgi:hypothetical protein
MGREKSESSEPLLRAGFLPLELGRETAGNGSRSSGDRRPKSFMQSPFWARFKASTGWNAYRFDLSQKTGDEDILVVLVRPWPSDSLSPIYPTVPDFRSKGSARLFTWKSWPGLSSRA